MGHTVRSLHQRVSVRFVAILALLCGFWIALAPDLTAQGGITITSPSANALLRAGPDFASDIIGDAWDMSNAEDISLDPMQRRGWTEVSDSLTGALVAPSRLLMGPRMEATSHSSSARTGAA